jgi:hypothetical protein
MIATFIAATFTLYTAFVWLIFFGSVVLTLMNAAGKFAHLWVPILLLQLFALLTMVGPA